LARGFGSLALALALALEHLRLESMAYCSRQIGLVQLK